MFRARSPSRALARHATVAAKGRAELLLAVELADPHRVGAVGAKGVPGRLLGGVQAAVDEGERIRLEDDVGCVGEHDL